MGNPALDPVWAAADDRYHTPATGFACILGLEVCRYGYGITLPHVANSLKSIG